MASQIQLYPDGPWYTVISRWLLRYSYTQMAPEVVISKWPLRYSYTQMAPQIQLHPNGRIYKGIRLTLYIDQRRKVGKENTTNHSLLKIHFISPTFQPTTGLLRGFINVKKIVHR